MPPPAKVLHLLRFDDWGGTEVQVATMLTSARGGEFEQGAAVLARPGPLHAALTAAGVEVHSLAGRLGTAGAALRLARLLRRGRYDLIEAYGFRAGLVARVSALLGGRPAVVIGVRGMHFAGSEDLDGRMTRFVIAAERALAWTVRCYEANSRGATAFLVSRGLPAEKFRVVPNGVELDVPRAAHAATARPRLICVARLVQGKRHDVLLRALAEVRAGGLAFDCEMVGGGPWLERLRALTARLGLTDCVSFAGSRPRDDAKARLAASDVFVLASVWEGLPGSILEAMAAGLPVVGTDVNGIRELVVDGVTGVLVPPDDVPALAAALARLLADADARRRMGAAGRRRVEREFSIATLIRRKEALLRELLSLPQELAAVAGDVAPEREAAASARVSDAL